MVELLLVEDASFGPTFTSTPEKVSRPLYHKHRQFLMKTDAKQKTTIAKTIIQTTLKDKFRAIFEVCIEILKHDKFCTKKLIEKNAGHLITKSKARNKKTQGAGLKKRGEQIKKNSVNHV